MNSMKEDKKRIQQVQAGKYGENAKFFCNYIVQDLLTLDSLTSDAEYKQILSSYIKTCQEYYSSLRRRSSKVSLSSTEQIDDDEQNEEKQPTRMQENSTTTKVPPVANSKKFALKHKDKTDV